ncbi:hypothetical protein P152DRAFT_406515, partial [Eremomyces bilateralis CBS 781.70]
FKIEYKPGRLNTIPDALSRRDQDIPKGSDDERIRSRFIQVLKGESIDHLRTNATTTETTPLQQLWDETIPQDEQYQDLLKAATENARQVPAAYKHLKLSMTDLSTADSRLL